MSRQRLSKSALVVAPDTRADRIAAVKALRVPLLAFPLLATVLVPPPPRLLLPPAVLLLLLLLVLPPGLPLLPPSPPPLLLLLLLVLALVLLLLLPLVPALVAMIVAGTSGPGFLLQPHGSKTVRPPRL
jgi:hypothetical protein